MVVSAMSASELWVDPITGTDAVGSGTQQKPYKTVLYSATAAAAIAAASPSSPVTVWLKGADYPPVIFDQSHSGKSEARITFKSAPGEAAKIMSGVRVPPSLFKATETTAPDGQPTIFTTDLRKLVPAGTDFGSLSPRLYGLTDCPVDKTALFYNGKSMTLAQYPNLNASTGYQQFMRTLQVRGSPKAQVAYEDQTLVPSSVFSTAGIGGADDEVGVGQQAMNFKLDDAPNSVPPTAVQVAKWQSESDLWFHGYWSYDWADSFVKVSQISIVDTHADTNASLGTQVVVDVQQNTPPIYNFLDKGRTVAVNALSELDMPGDIKKMCTHTYESLTSIIGNVAISCMCWLSILYCFFALVLPQASTILTAKRVCSLSFPQHHPLLLGLTPRLLTQLLRFTHQYKIRPASHFLLVGVVFEVACLALY